MIHSLHFVYDGVRSLDMNSTQASLSGGLFEEYFLAPKVINEVKVRNRDKPYFMGTEREPLTLPLTFYFEHRLSTEEINEIKRWLDSDYYKPFYFADYPEKIFYCMYQGDSKILHNGIANGVVTLQFRCNAPYAFSPVYTSEVYDLSTNVAEGTEITFSNNGDEVLKPILLLEKVGDGDVSLVNKSNGGKEFKFTSILNGEYLTIDNENKEIETDAIGISRYGNHNNVFLELNRGVSRLQVYGGCRIQFKYEFVIK
jgi:predicted phage tail component-like protein